MYSFVEWLDENTIRVLFYKAFFEKDAIFNAAYKVQLSFYIKIEPYEDDRVAVIMQRKPTQDMSSVEGVLKEFCNEVIDQQVRLDLERRTSNIRESIYRKAFEPLQIQKERNAL